MPGLAADRTLLDKHILVVMSAGMKAQMNGSFLRYGLPLRHISG